MEDEFHIEHGLNEGFTYAAVFDGHGGNLSSQWLKANLLASLAPRVDASLLADDDDQQEAAAAAAAAPDPAADPGPSPGDDAADADWRRSWLAKELVAGVRWPGRARRVFTEVFREVDARLIEYLKAEFGIERMGASGSTALVALVHPTRAVFASLGDCMAVVGRTGGTGKATQQHRVYGYGPDVLEELERIEATGAWVTDGRVCNVLAVSRAFGDPEFKGEGLKVLLREGASKGMWPKSLAEEHVFTSDPVIVEPDVTEVRFTEDDEFLILATDGLWDAVPVNEAAALTREQFSLGRSSQEVADALTDHALKRFTSDNATCIVVDLRSEARRQQQAGQRQQGGGWLGGLFGGR